MRVDHAEGAAAVVEGLVGVNCRMLQVVVKGDEVKD